MRTEAQNRVSMEHRAFLFDYARFAAELGSGLWHALETGDCTPVVRFTELNRRRLTDPYEGESLPDGWAVPADVHELGDFALTAYYDPADDVGLAQTWEQARDCVMRLMPGAEDEVVLGYPFGPEGAAFDPGRMGSYLRSAELARQHLGALTAAGSSLAALPTVLGPVQAMLQGAVSAGRGLYVTF
jgi:hypothetical protein